MALKTGDSDPESIEYEENATASGVHVKAATLHSLVLETINCFNCDTGEVTEFHRPFVNTVLGMHQWFTSSLQLLEKLIGFTDLKRDNMQSNKKLMFHERCMCSNLAIRRRHNASLSRLTSCTDSNHLHSVADGTTDVMTKSELKNTFSEVDALSDQIYQMEDLKENESRHTDTYSSLEPAQHSAKLHSLELQCRLVCHVLRHWMMSYPIHFESDLKLQSSLNQFKCDIATHSMTSKLSSLLVTNQKAQNKRKLNLKIVGNFQRDNPNQSKISLVLHSLSTEELAKYLSYVDYKACRRLTFQDFEMYAKRSTMGGIIRLERSVTVFNGITQWVQLMILSKTHPRQRAAFITRFTQVSEYLLEMRSYNTMMAVVGALTHSNMARLHKTNTYLSTDTQQLLRSLSDLVSSKNNYHSYRKLMSEAIEGEHLFLPIVGIHLKDLVALNAAQPDTVGDDLVLINLRKMAKLSGVLSCLTTIHQQAPAFRVNSDILDTLKLAIDVFYSEEEIYELSLAREPRINNGSIAPASVPTSQSALPVDWRAESTLPDRSTLDKRVSKTVKAIFRNYDRNGNGFISLDEFETISTNFPFIESFGALDIDENGLLSQQQVKEYFLLAKCTSMRRTFKHNFVEMTYFKLKFCDHCSGLLEGAIIKHGWKCKDCSINAHKACKDRIVMECKQTAVRATVPSVSPATSAHTQSIRAQKQLSPTTPTTPELGEVRSRFTFNRHSSVRHTANLNEEETGNEEYHPPGSNTSANYLSTITTKSVEGEELLEHKQLISELKQAIQGKEHERKQLQDICRRQRDEILSLRHQLVIAEQVSVTVTFV